MIKENRIKKINSDRWYELAVKQTIESLPAFTEKVCNAFPGQVPGMERDEEGYNNAMFAGILITLAAFHASSNKYTYFCNQTGVVRNGIYQAINGKYTNYEDM